MLGVGFWPMRFWKLRYWYRVARPDWLAQRKLRREPHHDFQFFWSDEESGGCDSCGYEHDGRFRGRRMVGYLSGYYEPEWLQHCVRCLYRDMEFWSCQPMGDLEAWARSE